MAQQENRALGCDFREALGNQRKEDQKNHSTSVVKKINVEGNVGALHRFVPKGLAVEKRFELRTE